MFLRRDLGNGSGILFPLEAVIGGVWFYPGLATVYLERACRSTGMGLVDTFLCPNICDNSLDGSPVGKGSLLWLGMLLWSIGGNAWRCSPPQDAARPNMKSPEHGRAGNSCDGACACIFSGYGVGFPGHYFRRLV